MWPRDRDHPIRVGLRYLRTNSRLVFGALRRRVARLDVIVGVTGSAGKSTVSRLVGAILRQKGRTYVAHGTNTYDGLRRRYRFAPLGSRHWVQEISGHQPGEVKASASFVQPNIGIVTRVEQEHFKAFDSFEALADGKADLVRALSSGGTAILNADDSKVAAMKNLTTARVLTFGINAGDVRVVRVEGNLPDPVVMTFDDRGTELTIRTKFAGSRWAIHFAAAIAAASAAGVARQDVVQALEAIEPDLYRDSVHVFDDESMIILDCFKATFWTVPTSIETLAEIAAPRKTFILGTLSDYRGSPRSRYTEAVKAALEVADRVFVYGPHAYRMQRMLPDNAKRLALFDTFVDLQYRIETTAIAKEAIYVKATSVDHLERLMHHRRYPIICFEDRCGVTRRSCNSCKKLYNKRFSRAQGAALR